MSSDDDAVPGHTQEGMELQLPIRVQGYDPDGTRWEEMTIGESISSKGAAFVLKHEVVKGQALLLSLPLPKRYRAFDPTTPSYRVYALTRGVEKCEAGFLLGTMFVGKNPPRGYEENPSIRYLLPGETRTSSALSKPTKLTPDERRVEPRFQVFLNLRVQGKNATGDVLEEHTVAENLSRNGARVPTTLPLGKGDIVWVAEIGGSFMTRAEVRGVSIGKDNIPRLGLKFLDQKVPERLIAP
jgi:PilZ domain-containing protein